MNVSYKILADVGPTLVIWTELSSYSAKDIARFPAYLIQFGHIMRLILNFLKILISTTLVQNVAQYVNFYIKAILPKSVILRNWTIFLTDNLPVYDKASLSAGFSGDLSTDRKNHITEGEYLAKCVQENDCITLAVD